jgi:hypothetical protein
MISGEQRFAGFDEKELAVGRQTGAARRAVDESATDLTFEVGNLFADCRLRDVELAAGFTEGAVFGDSTEVAQVSQFHGLILLLQFIGYSDGDCRKYL